MPITRTSDVPVPGTPIGSEPYQNVLIARMKQVADLSSVATMPRGPERRAAAFEQLSKVARDSQVGALAKLAEMKSQGLVDSFESMYLPNAIVVKAAAGKSKAVQDALAGVAEIQKVQQNHTWSVPSTSSALADAASGALDATSRPRADEPTSPGPEWGVARIGAPAAWAAGYTGAGITVGVVDTGLDASHPAIRGHYRGTNADGSVIHDYNWFDPTAGRTTPYDDGEHGTHCAGTVAGGTDGRVIGVAPGAKLIAAKAILGSGYNTTEATLKALQWMLAPTDSSGANPDPRRGADIVSNSWGNADRTDTTFQETWNAMQAAGVIMVTAAGNDGMRGVSTPGSYLNGISVAASSSEDRIAGFSSRGPSPFDPSKIVPMVTAPGVRVTSSVPGGRYAAFDGTSMATPHVAGAIALMLQAKPDASYDQIVQALEKTAVDIGDRGPDLAAGYGRIDVARAIDHLQKGGAVAVAARAAAA